MSETTQTAGANITSEMVPIFIMGKKYEVPGDLTIMKAMEYAGFQFVRGCGCRGGICGACGTVWRHAEDYKLLSGLACQTVVESGMYLTQLPFFPANRGVYKLEELQANLTALQQTYPEHYRCLQCNSCTKVCPMDVDVMQYMAAALRGDIERAAELSFNCIMCGLCAARCPAELAQMNIAILMRRLYGKYLASPAIHAQEQVNLINEGKYDECMARVKKVPTEELKKVYTARQLEPDIADEFWTPDDKTCIFG